MTLRRSISLLLFALATGPIFGASSVPTSFDDCSALVRDEPRARASYACYALVARHNGDFRGAVRRLEAYLSIRPDNALALYTLASVEGWRRNERAFQLFREAAAAFEAEGETPLAVSARIDLSYALAASGRFPEAQRELALAARKAAETGDPLSGALVQTVQAGLASRSGRYEEAETRLLQAERVIFEQGSIFARMQWLSLRGASLWGQGRNAESLEIYRREVAARREAGDLFDEATARSNVVLLASSFLGPVDPSSMSWIALRQEIEETVDVARQGRNLPIEAKSRLFLAQIETDVPEKRRHLHETLSLLERVGGLEDHLLALRILSDSLVMDEPRDPPAGLDAARAAVDLARRHGAAEQVVRGRILLATLMWESLSIESEIVTTQEGALDASRLAFDVIENLRDLQRDELVRARVFSRFAFFYERVVGHLLSDRRGAPDRERLDLAHQIMERKRARILLEELDAARVIAAYEKASGGDGRRKALLEEIARLNEILTHTGITRDERESTAAKLALAEREESLLRASITHLGPVFADLRAPSVPSLDELQGQLSDSQAVFSFQTGPEQGTKHVATGGSWLLVLTRQGSRVYELPGRGDIERRSAMLTGLLARRDDSYEAGSRSLARDLLGDALRDLPPGIEELIVIPEGPLLELPLGVLSDPRNDRPLAESYGITIVPSLTVWLRWRAEETREELRGVLAVADPALPGVDESSPAETRSLLTSLGELPLARNEIAALRRHLGGDTTLLAGPEAGEAAFKRHCGTAKRLIHVAAHALADIEHPERSCVVLARDQEGEDGLLFPRELAGLALGGSVVVLSGCQSAGGGSLAGEGVMSLARAFFVGGASAVLGSLWPLRDDDAALFFDAFYARVAEGASLAEAHRAARIDLMRKGAPPEAWAGIVLLGNGALVLQPDAGPWARLAWRPWLATALAVSGLLLAALAIKRRWFRD